MPGKTRGRTLHLLAGDVGGTNVRLAFYEADGATLSLLFERSYASREHRGLDEILARFLDESLFRADRLCLGVAGPVRDGRCRLTNLSGDAEAEAVGAK
ncbi:MAG TPA: glucokinase, partial [Thermoanaerobaculia bacterium]|nr:glucokinase [Thermoanaerobaculia bacterium]